MDRKKKLVANTFSALIYQITVLVCGLILPRMILAQYGSDTNGLVNSISRFLSLITFMEFGVYSVVQSALYKPLAEKNNEEMSKVLASARKFFNNIAKVLTVYVIFLILIFPFLIDSDFGFVYTATLITSMSISYFAQYYFGLVDQILITADQRAYINNVTQIITTILNTAVCVVMIKMGCGIQVYKLVSSLVYLLRPLVVHIYIRRHYEINYKATYTEEPIKQKWNGIAQQISSIVLGDTDVIVLTLFASLSSVSVYSVYNLVLSGVKQLLTSAMQGFQSLMGELYARNDITDLNRVFALYEWIVHNFSIFVFGCTATLLVPFVSVYIKGVNDANYIVPLFALLISLAHGLHCLRLPYNVTIMACNHYKQTQANHIISAILNLSISILTVKNFGLIGVAIGTLVAMAYQTIWMAWYTSNNLLGRSFRFFIKQITSDIIIWLFGFYMINISSNLLLNTYMEWFFLAVKVAIVWITLIFIVNIILYKNNIISLIQYIKKGDFNSDSM